MTVTVAELVQHTPDELGAALAPLTERDLDLHAMSSPTRRSVERQLSDEVDALMHRDIVSVLASGWRASSALRQAARDTVAQPGLRIVVELHSQQIDDSVHPSITVYVNDAPCGTVALTITLEVSFETLSAVVADAAIVGVEFGECVLSVSVADDQGTELFRRSATIADAATLTLPGRIALL